MLEEEYFRGSEITEVSATALNRRASWKVLLHLHVTWYSPMGNVKIDQRGHQIQQVMQKQTKVQNAIIL